MTLRTVTVPLGDRSYDVHVGAGAVARLPDLLPPTARRVAMVTQAGIPFADRGRARCSAIASSCASTSATGRRASRSSPSSTWRGRSPGPG